MNTDKTPERERELALALRDYTDPNHPDYDADLDGEVRALRPDWFTQDTEEVQETEEE